MLITDNGNNYFALKKEDKSINKDIKLLEKVKKYIQENNAISVSRIQCEFSIGYTKAQKIMSQLIEEGLVELLKDGKYIVKVKN